MASFMIELSNYTSNSIIRVVDNIFEYHNIMIYPHIVSHSEYPISVTTHHHGTSSPRFPLVAPAVKCGIEFTLMDFDRGVSSAAGTGPSDPKQMVPMTCDHQNNKWEKSDGLQEVYINYNI